MVDEIFEGGVDSVFFPIIAAIKCNFLRMIDEIGMTSSIVSFESLFNRSE